MFEPLDRFDRRRLDLGGLMRRDLAFTGVARHVERPARSIACLVFVAFLGVAFWAGAAWIAASFLRTAPGF
jgi:hypothetical protein